MTNEYYTTTTKKTGSIELISTVESLHIGLFYYIRVIFQSIVHHRIVHRRVRLVRVSGPTRLTGCRRAAFGCLHRPQSQALQMQFPFSGLHPQKRQKQSFLQSQARLMQLFLSLMMH
jgi:hypothetical protein